MGFEICKERCNQCLFSENKIVSDKRKKQLLQEIIRDQSYFNCHKATIKGKETCCKGFYDAFGHISQMIRIAERIGAIEFVNEEAEQ